MRGQQRRLDAPRGLEVVLEGTPLAGVEVIEAVLQQRIAGQPVGLDRVVADLAQTVGAAVEAVESGVDRGEQTLQLLGLGFDAGGAGRRAGRGEKPR